jgi:hypothetical protein
MARISYDIKQRIIDLSGACFWYWRSYYTFLDSSGIPKRLQNKYPRDAFNKYDMMRNILNELEDADDTETISNITSNLYRMKRAADADVPDPNRAKELLEEFRTALGSDPIEVEIEKRKRDEARVNHTVKVEGNKSKRLKLEELNKLFLDLHTTTEFTPQQRGYKLEDIFCDLLALSEMDYKRPYKHKGEQIDGHFTYDKFDYLIESKWEKNLIRQEGLSVFDGKIRGKAQSTRGFFIATNGFDENAIRKYSGDSPRIILMTGEDLALTLGGQVDFKDGLKAKMEAIVRHGKIDFALRNMT